jgi:hypothetical protein
MQPFPPHPTTKKDDGRPTSRTPADPYASLFTTGKSPSVKDPENATRRIERSSRIAGDVKRALFFAVVLVFVAVVLYQFVSAF